MTEFKNVTGTFANNNHLTINNGFPLKNDQFIVKSWASCGTSLSYGHSNMIA